jgi:hypothetical protein
MRRLLFGAIVLAALAWCGRPAEAVTLVKNGQPASAIIVSANATMSANMAAREIQYHIEKMSGVKLPILISEQVRPPYPPAFIFVGRSPHTDRAGINLAGVPPEGFIIRTVGNVLAIVGQDSKHTGPAENVYTQKNVRCGTMFGAYDFLQDQLGCQWIWPGPTGEFIPKRTTIAVDNLNVKEGPALQRRHMRMTRHKGFGPAERLYDMSVTKELSEQERQWYYRMRMGSNVNAPSGHSFTDWWKKYGTTHPNIFAMLSSGKRGYAGSDPTRVKMCVSNPELWDIQIKEFRSRGAHDLPASENDGKSGFCTCPNCKAWDLKVEELTPEQKADIDPEHLAELQPIRGDGLPECLSNRYARWYNELAKRVRAIDPQGYVTAYAYTNFRERPIGIKMEPNLLIGYIGFNGYPRTPEQSKVDRNHYLGWAQPGVRMYVRPNTPHYVENGQPFMVAHEMGEDLKWCMENGAYMMDVDSLYAHFASWGPSYYIWCRLMWDGPKADIEGILNEWYSAFGPAEQQVRAYYAFWEEHLKSMWYRPGETEKFEQLGQDWDKGGNRVGRLLIVADHYPTEAFAQARTLLGAAFTAAQGADPLTIEKLKNIEMSLKNGEMTADATRLSIAARKDPKKLADLKTLLTGLIAYRRQIADRNAVDVFWQTREEISLGNVLHWDMIPDFGK